VLAAVFSALHLMALAIGLGSVWMRGRALRSRTFDKEAIRRVLVADNFWGIAALLFHRRDDGSRSLAAALSVV